MNKSPWRVMLAGLAGIVLVALAMVLSLDEVAGHPVDDAAACCGGAP